jgi:hypothetical protein
MTDRRSADLTLGSERGQAAPLALLALLFAVVLAVGVVRVGDAAGRGAAAQASADASALAGAAGGEAAAIEVATANQARVVRFAQVGDDVRVTVEQRGATATARARWQPVPIP